MDEGSINLASDAANLDRPCPLHQGKNLKFFYTKHDYFGCSFCWSEDHNGCKKVQSIERASKGIESSADYKRFEDVQETVAFMVQCTNHKIERNKRLAEKRRDFLLKNVKNAKAEISQLLEKAEKEIEDEIVRKYEEDLQRFEKVFDICKSVSDDLGALRVRINSFKKTSQYDNLFIELKGEERNVEKMKNMLEKQCDGTSFSKYVLQRKVPPQNILEFKSEHWFGTLVAMDTKTSQVTLDSTLDVRKEGDQKTCKISEAIALEDGTFAVLDSSHKTIKLIDADQGVVSQIKVSEDNSPCGITETTNNQIAVTVPEENAIVILCTTNNALVEDRRVKTQNKCFGIGSVMDNFVVSVKLPKGLDILDKNGNFLKTASVGQEYQQLFDDMSNITLSPDCATIYVSDQVKFRVTSVSLVSKKSTTYSSSFLLSASLAVDQSGLVYISDVSSNNIVQTTADLRRVRILVKKLRKPQTIAYCDARDRIIVDSNFCDQMKLFKLSP